MPDPTCTSTPASRDRRPRSLRLALVGVVAAVSTALAVGAAAAPADAAVRHKHHVKHKHHKKKTRHVVKKKLTTKATKAGLKPTGGGEIGWSAPTTGTTATTQAGSGSTVLGIDVARYQGNVNWASYYSQGKRFAFVKATEGNSYTSPTFTSQYTGAANAGMVRGAYHFANPSGADGATQAQFFATHGGGWSADGKTLPGVLDIEYNPYTGGTCYGLSQTAMRSWIAAFTTKYKALTGRDAIIYSTTDWWKTCTGNTSAFAATNPLWIARYNTTVGTLPAGWGYWTFWQYSSKPLDQDRFNGTMAQLRKLATG